MQMLNGYIFMHEHMAIDLSMEKNDPDARKVNLQETIKELKQLYTHGVRTILDVTTIGMGRDIAFIDTIQQETGIEILVSTGFYKEPFLPSIVYDLSVNDLASFMIKELQVGCDESNKKAVCIGEIGTSNGKMTEMEQKVFDASIIVAKHCDTFITTHTTLATYALEQVDYLLKNDIRADHIIIGHVALSKNLSYIKKILKKGVYIGFDTIGKAKYISDKEQAEMLLALERDDLLDQVVLSLDLTRNSHMKHKRGIGYCYMFEVFLPLLREMGIKEESIQKMLIENPRKILRKGR